MKKIIVTGGLGFIGSNLIDLLLKKNLLNVILITKKLVVFLINTNQFVSLI